ncbi:MAG: TonB-dependent receptor [Acidobacteria bacterium]|nr:TonB-dependent receptor [Acidobacteriota bacterium]
MKEIISYLKAVINSKLIVLSCLLFCLAITAYSQQGMKVKGQVLDESGASLAGADVTLVAVNGKSLQTVSSEKGAFEFSRLEPGTYTLKVSVIGFNSYESEPFNVENAAVIKPFEVHLAIASVTEQITVDASSPVSLSSENNATAIVLKGKDLETLPEDPDELANALQELAGPAAGPNGAQLFVDGFNGIRLPPRNSIREIRINTNPFSSEYDRLGFGRIEILTKPGLDQLHGEAFFNFNDESLNSRNAFAPFRAPLQVRRFGGNLSGAIKPKKSSFFIDFERRETDENTSVNATVLDSNLFAVPFSTVILTPQRSTNFSSRIDYQLDDKTTFVSRYSFTEINNENQGIGNFSLASRGFDNTIRINTLNFTATTIINPKVINEVRLQLTKQTSESMGDNSTPSLNVLGSFFGGGAQVGRSRRSEERFELQDYISIALSKHTLKTGLRFRGGRVTSNNTENFGGSYSFAGDVNRDSNGRPIGGTITSLEQLRRTLLGLTGYRPSQFSINAGDPFVSVNQYDVGVFLQDEWRVRQNLTLSGGIRYEAQTNLGAKYNFAPRLAFAYSPRSTTNNSSNSNKLATVIRGGFGIFYDRFDDSFTLDTRRLDGNHIRQFIATNPDFFPVIPNVSNLTAIRPIRRQIEPELEAPYVMQFAIGVEQQLPFNLSTTFNYLFSRSNHLLRSRNINAPLPGTFTGVNGSGVRPLGDVGDIYLYEASGVSRMHQVRVGVTKRAGNLTFFSNYAYTKIDSNADGANSFPSSSFDLEPEYGRSSLQTKHAVFLGSSYSAPYGIRINPFLIIRSGRPFDITTGRDNNGDTRFTDRPSFAEPGTPGSITNEYGTFNPNPRPGETIIPRNLGQGPGFASLNLAVSKTFGFGEKQSSAANQGNAGMQPVAGGFGGRPGGGPGGGGPGGRSPGGGFGNAGSSDKRFNVTLTIRASNLFNRTNLGNFTGSLASPIFGESNFASEARRLEAQLRFRF